MFTKECPRETRDFSRLNQSSFLLNAREINALLPYLYICLAENGILSNFHISHLILYLHGINSTSIQKKQRILI